MTEHDSSSSCKLNYETKKLLGNPQESDHPYMLDIILREQLHLIVFVISLFSTQNSKGIPKLERQI